MDKRLLVRAGERTGEPAAVLVDPVTRSLADLETPPDTAPGSTPIEDTRIPSATGEPAGPAPFVPGEALLSAPVAGAMLVTAVNDHWLKAAAPGWLTGKLSDFAGLYFFPFLVVAILELARELFARARGTRPRRGTSARAFAVLLGLEALLFTVLEVWPAGARRFGEVWSALSGLSARFTADPSDLCALLVLPLAWHTARARGLLDESIGP